MIIIIPHNNLVVLAVSVFLFIYLYDKQVVHANRDPMERAKMQKASSVIEPASWEQQVTSIATSDEI